MQARRAFGLFLSLGVVACSSPVSAPGAGTGGGGPGSGGSTATATGGTTAGTGGMSTGSGGSAGTGGLSASTGGSAGTGGLSAGTGGPGSGGSAGTGGLSASTGGKGSGGAPAGSGGSSLGGTPGGPLIDRLTSSDVVVTAAVKAGVRNYRIWTSSMLRVAPVFTAPLANCGTLVCYTSGTAAAPNARVVRLDAADQLAAMVDLGAGLECRGVAAEPDGHFAALLWDNAADKIYVKRFDLAGMPGWSTELTNSDNHPNAFDIGEGRFEFGGGKYGAYYHVHSDSGHEGDTLKFTDAAAGTQSTQWSWGCSHSMSNLLTYSAQANSFLPSCVTDCYPGTSSSDFATGSFGGVYTDNKNRVMNVDAGCDGNVAGELGGAAVASTGWKIVFNAHQAAATMGQSSYSTATMNQDIAFATIATNHTLSGTPVWLTTTAMNEADSAIARWQPDGDATEQYVVGWMEPSTPAAYKLSRVGTTGAFIEAPIDVVSKARWGQRDDPFRVHVNHDIIWAWFDAAGATTLHVARLRSGASAKCAAF